MNAPNNPGLTLVSEIARAHAARLCQGYWGKPITTTLIKASRWDGTTRKLRDILAHYRNEFSRESDRHKVGNANLKNLEIWSGCRWWPQASDAWRWGYQWTPDRTGKLTGAATIETNPGAQIHTYGWWTIAALLDYRPILDATTPEQVTEWAPHILKQIADADARGGLGGITVDWVRAALQEVAPDVDLTVPAKVTDAHVRTLYTTIRDGNTEDAILANKMGDVHVGKPRTTDTILYTGKEMSAYLRGELDVDTLDPDIVETLTNGINDRIDEIPGDEAYLGRPYFNPYKLWHDRAKLGEAFRAHFDGRDLVLCRDHAYRHRLAPASTAAERGWKVLDMDAVLESGQVWSKEDLGKKGPGGEVTIAVASTAEMIGHGFDAYWKDA